VRLIVSITLALSLSPLLLHPTFSIGYAHRFHYLGSYLARVNIDLRSKCICNEEVEFIGISLLIQRALNILHLRPSSSSSSPKESCGVILKSWNCSVIFPRSSYQSPVPNCGPQQPKPSMMHKAYSLNLVVANLSELAATLSSSMAPV